MNDNIRRLLAQAYLEQADIQDTTKIAEKFAELIVQECAAIAERPHEYIKTQSGKQILKHFGVEHE